MNKKPSIGERILVFFISLICLAFLYPFLSYSLSNEMMWKVMPFIPLVAIFIACFYDKFSKNK